MVGRFAGRHTGGRVTHRSRRNPSSSHRRRDAFDSAPIDTSSFFDLPAAADAPSAAFSCANSARRRVWLNVPQKRAAKAEATHRQDDRRRLQVVEGGWSPDGGERDQAFVKTIRAKSKGSAGADGGDRRAQPPFSRSARQGTGKTYLAIAKAVDALQAGKVGRIVLSRPAVEAGESLASCLATWKKNSPPISARSTTRWLIAFPPNA